MVKRLLINLAIEYGTRVGKSFINAYQKVINSMINNTILTLLL